MDRIILWWKIFFLSNYEISVNKPLSGPFMIIAFCFLILIFTKSKTMGNFKKSQLLA